jgi:hypothetical protein
VPAIPEELPVAIEMHLRADLVSLFSIEAREAVVCVGEGRVARERALQPEDCLRGTIGGCGAGEFETGAWIAGVEAGRLLP